MRWLIKGGRRNAGASAHVGTRDRAGTAGVKDHQGHRMPKPHPHEAAWPPTVSVAPSHADGSFPRLKSVHGAMAHERGPEECWGERARRGTRSRWYGGRERLSGASYAKATPSRSRVATHSERRPLHSVCFHRSTQWRNRQPVSLRPTPPVVGDSPTTVALMGGWLHLNSHQLLQRSPDRWR